MLTNKKFLASSISVLLMLSAFSAFYLQPFWMSDQMFAGKALYEHVSSFKLSQVPVVNLLVNQVVWADLTERPLYITAGFTSCPNTCPVTISHYQVDWLLGAGLMLRGSQFAVLDGYSYRKFRLLSLIVNFC